MYENFGNFLLIIFTISKIDFTIKKTDFRPETRESMTSETTRLFCSGQDLGLQAERITKNKLKALLRRIWTSR